MGNMENIASYARKLFQKGLVYVYDGTFTSEGLEGIHFQYALRWAEKNPQTYYWFKMQGLENENIGLGVIPKNKENLRHRVINSPVIYNELTNKIEKNLSYNPNKETYFQIYDGSQVSEHQLSKLDKPIENYEKIKSNNLLAINNHNDTLINYVFQIDTKEYINRLKTFIEFNKNNNKPLKLNSPEGTIFIGQFSNFKIDAKTEGGVVTWDANTDMIKLNYFISGYDEKLNQAKNSATQKDYETKMRIRGAYEVQDMTLQAGRYWTKTFSNIQKIYIAQVLKGCNSSEKLINLINNGLLPKEAFLNQETIENILNGFYNLNPKGLLAKDDTTLKAIMDFPLESLEFAENTVGVLSTSYFSNRAIDEKTLGLTRYELFTNDNPHLVEPYKKNYENINSLFKYDIKEFANKIIEKLNETSSEKLLDKNNNYTEYGEYIIELMGNSITKYAFLKSLAGDKLKTKILPNGEITYDYKHLKDITTLKSLGIDGVSPKDEAQQLTNLITEGIKNLNDSDINYIVKSLENRIKDTNVNSFRLSEAIFNNSGLGLAWRLDAMKDITDQDSLRNKETSFDKNWNNVIKFWSNFVQVVKKESPDSYIIAEITDLDALMRDNYGENINAYDNNMPMENAKYKNVNDALIKFYNETGITSEAAYSSFFTDLIKVFAPEFENGTSIKDTTRIHNFTNKFVELINTRSSNFTRNLYTFVGNHDKPRIIHGLALDMNLFHSNLSIFKSGNDINYLTNREPRIKSLIQLTNSDNYESLPLEAKLNVDNPDYFRTTSTYAVAMSQLLRDSLNNCKSIINNPNQIKYLKLALVDLTNGNYLGNGSSIKIPSINIPELSSAENLLNLILEKSHIQLSPNEITAILNQTKNLEFVNQFNIQGDFNWDIDENNAYIGKKNKKLLK